MAAPEPERLRDADPSPPRRARMSPSARRADLVAAARGVLTVDSDTGVAEIAQAAQVSKALLYRYFPAGRAELVGAVVADLANELLTQVDQAAGMPFSPAVRLEQMLAAVFAFFAAEPGAYRLLVGPHPDASTPEAAGQTRAARVGLVSSISAVLADGGQTPRDVLAAATGLVGFALATVELCLTGQLAAERAWQLSCRCAQLLAEPPDASAG
jgi:AcrR family transcriptional regulator